MSKVIKRVSVTFIVLNVFMFQSIMADILFYYSAAVLPSIIASQEKPATPVLLSFCGQENGNELWKSDGTEEGTMEVKDINTGDNGSDPEYLTYMDDTLFFSANQVRGYRTLEE